jgi:hypothetical protein
MSSHDIHDISQLLDRKAAESKSSRQKLDDALQEARRTEAVWNRLLEAQRYGRSAEIVGIFRKESDVFGRLRDTQDEAVPMLESLFKESENQAKNTARRFATFFPEACDAAGLDLSQSSRHPKYSLQEFIQLVVDERKLEAQVTPRDANSTSIPLDIEVLVAHLQAEVGRLFNTKRDPKNFLAGLRKAYQAVLREEKKALGDELPLRRVANRLSKNRKHFRYDEFNIDLGNIIQSGKTSIENVRLHLNHTRDTRQGMLLYGLERSGYVGFISFKHEAS